MYEFFLKWTPVHFPRGCWVIWTDRLQTMGSWMTFIKSIRWLSNILNVVFLFTDRESDSWNEADMFCVTVTWRIYSLVALSLRCNKVSLLLCYGLLTALTKTIAVLWNNVQMISNSFLHSVNLIPPLTSPSFSLLSLLHLFSHHV